MKRPASPLWHVALIPALLLAACALACQSTPTPTLAPAPRLDPIPTRAAPSSTALVPTAVEGFDAGIEGWHAWAEEGSRSEVTWNQAGKLLWTSDPAPGQATVLFHEWPALSGADGLTIRLTSLDRFAYVILGVNEADGSAYSVVLPLGAARPVEHTISFAGFGLNGNSEDENGQLDRGQIASLGLVDISGVIAAPLSNQVAVDEITLWTGEPAPADLSCGTTQARPAGEFRVGIDANYVPQGEQRGESFRASSRPVDPLDLFAANGVDGFRIRLWVGNEGESKLDYATDLARRAQQAGMHPYLVLFLSDDWSDVNKQPAPAAWANLPVDERAAAIRAYARETAQHFVDQGITLDFYEIGNEIDYGISGVFADATHPRDPATLRADTWPDEAQLIQAAIDGVREADPDARFLLHIATGWDGDFAVAFFQAMTDLGVTYDYAGLSYYPTSFGPPIAAELCHTLDRLGSEIGKPIVIAETAYPAEPPTGGMFGDWRRPLPGYPLTPEGQAWWLADLLAGMRARGDVRGVYVFSPDFWFSGELWGPFALFDDQGEARPAVASFNQED